MLTAATIEQALAQEEKSVVIPEELAVLRSRRRRWLAVRATRKASGRTAASEHRQLQREQLKLARMIADGEKHVAGQRSRILALRRNYEASVKTAEVLRGHPFPQLPT